MLDTDNGKDEAWAWEGWPRVFRDLAFGVSALSALVAVLAVSGLSSTEKGDFFGIIAIWWMLCAGACEYINRANESGGSR